MVETADKEVAGVSTTPTQGMADAAQRGLDMVQDDMGGDGLQESTVQRARKIARRTALSRDEVMKGSAFWGRNGNYCNEDASDAQRTSANLWGGCSAGLDWFPRKADAIREAESSRDVGVYVKTSDTTDMSHLPYEAKRGGTVKDVDVSTNTVMGYYASFGNVDADRDEFAAGAFEETIAKRGPNGSDRIRHLWQHNASQPIGRPLVLREDQNGLYFETQIVDTQAGTDALKLYDAGVITEHSVGFNRVDAEPRDDGSTLITRVKLWEGSSVTWGANAQTPFVGMKGLTSRDDLVEKLNALRAVLREGLSERTAEQIEIGLRQVEAALRADEKRETVDLTQTLKGGFWPDFEEPTATSHDTSFFPSIN